MRGSGPKPSRRRHEKRSPGPKPGAITRTQILAASTPARQRRWPNGRLKYAPTGLEVFPVDPDTKAPIGATEGANGETYGWQPKATVRHHRPRTITAMVDVRPDALIGGRIPKDVVVLDIDPRHDGQTHGTPSSPATIYRQHGCTSLAATTAAFTFGFSTPTVADIDDRRRNRRSAPGVTATPFCRPSPHRQPAAPILGSDALKISRCCLPEWLAERTHTGTQAPLAPPGPTHHSQTPTHGDGPTPPNGTTPPLGPRS